MTDTTGISDAQLSALIDLVRQQHNFDFSGYSKSSLKRRLSRIIMLKKITFDELLKHLIDEPEFFQWFLEEITVNVTEMFRDPIFYRALNTQVIPELADLEYIRVWCAGCSSGEEVYSLSILLHHAGLGEQAFIYGTDIHTVMLSEARKGIYSKRKLNNYQENYKQSDMPGSLTHHFTMMNDVAAINGHLRKNTLFSVHNLITDQAFNEFQLISCRNVFIYFDAFQQEKVLKLFYDSLSLGGFLCLGTKETIRFPEMKNRFRVINSRANIYQKI
ncbi:MAG: CheR family methyltransferase [Mucilaginibacter sp.]